MRPCRWCGVLRPSLSNKVVCVECRRKRKSEPAPSYQAHGASATVVRDPSGEFAPGATFGGADFVATLRAGYWPDGLVVERARVKWRVHGTELHPC